MTQAPPPTSRAKLRCWLRTHLVDIELGEVSDWTTELEQLLNAAIDGLDDLDRGEVPEIFRAAKNPKKSRRPATIERIELEALGYVALLQELGDSLTTARSEVADVFGYGYSGHGAIRKWREKWTKEAPDSLQEAERSAIAVYRTHKQLHWPYPDKGTVLETIRRLAKRYKDIKEKI
jgi:hypothetical protein